MSKLLTKLNLFDEYYIKMINRFFVIFFLYFTYLINLFGLNNSISYKHSDDFLKIIEQKNFELNLISCNENELSHKDIFYYYCMFSENQEKYDIYLNWFLELTNLIDNKILNKFNLKNISYLSTIQNEKTIEYILEILHDLILKKYNSTSYKLSDLIENQEYNCVSSTILFYIFLKKYGINSYPVETKDHVFIKVILNNEEFDVETTNRYGFNPGNKKEVLDEFGKLTGFAYIPPQNYKDRNNINIKKLISMIYNNLYEKYATRNDYIKSVNLGFIVLKLRNDNKGANLFESVYYNMLVYLYNQKKIEKVIDLINSFFIYFYQIANFVNFRYDALLELVKNFNTYDNFEVYNFYLLTQNNLFNNLKNSDKFMEIYNLYFYKNLIFNIKNNFFEKNYFNFNILKQIYTDMHTEEFFELIIEGELKSYGLSNNIVFQRIHDLKLLYPDYLYIIGKYDLYYQKEEIKNLLSNNNFDIALDKAKKLNINFQNDNSVKIILADCYLKYSKYLYDNNSLNDLIKIIDESLIFFPNDITLKNNYLNYFKNFIDEYINQERYYNARLIYNIAVEKFTDDEYFNKVDKILQKYKY